LPLSFGNALRTIGPGAILLAAAIGGGEWIVGPMMVVNYGSSILWIATAAILLQSIFNLEACRYTLYTGEPILTGIMRLRPGPAVWATVFGLLGLAQLSTPALAKGCAGVLFAAFSHRLPGEADELTVTLITSGLIVVSVVLLLSGKSIERVLERLSAASSLRTGFRRTSTCSCFARSPRPPAPAGSATSSSQTGSATRASAWGAASVTSAGNCTPSAASFQSPPQTASAGARGGGTRSSIRPGCGASAACWGCSST
jgi:hypothetical protein